MKVVIVKPDGKAAVSFNCANEKDIERFYEYETIQDMMDSGYAVIIDGRKLSKKQIREWVKRYG